MWAEVGGLPRGLILQSFSRRIAVTIIGDDRGENMVHSIGSAEIGGSQIGGELGACGSMAMAKVNQRKKLGCGTNVGGVYGSLSESIDHG